MKIEDKEIQGIERGTKYWNFIFRDSSNFEKIRQPEFAQDIANSISRESTVKIGMTPTGNWMVQSVKIKTHGNSMRKAMDQGKKVQTKVDDAINSKSEE